MSEIFVHGIGAVSPAGWNVAALREALAKNLPLETKNLERPGWTETLRVRQVPPPSPRPAFMAHARFRRTSPISQYSVSAALEALGEDAAQVSAGKLKLGIVLCTLAGSLNYCRRFYAETLKDPTTASPLIFPETVFNAPASHLAALLGTTAINYTLVGDPGTFLQGLALAADWLLSRRMDGCVVVGAEELDWLAADAMRLFDHKVIVADGAGAIYLRREPSKVPTIRLDGVTDSQLFANNQHPAEAAKKVRAELFATPAQNHLLCDGQQNLSRFDAAEKAAWRDWNGARISPKLILGEALMAASAWQCVAAVDALAQKQYAGASVSVVGCNEQAIGARFVK